MASILYMPGYSLIGKMDRYLCLDGLWISRWGWVWLPGVNFLRRRQLSFSMLFAFTLLLFWSQGDDVKNELLLSSIHSSAHKEEVVQSSLDSKGESTSMAHQPSMGEVMGRNLKQKSQFIEGVVAPSSDKIHFYRENWIKRLPFEWQND